MGNYKLGVTLTFNLNSTVFRLTLALDRIASAQRSDHKLHMLLGVTDGVTVSR